MAAPSSARVTVVSRPRSASTFPISCAISPVAPCLVAAVTRTFMNRSFRAADSADSRPCAGRILHGALGSEQDLLDRAPDAHHSLAGSAEPEHHLRQHDEPARGAECPAGPGLGPYGRAPR